MKKLALVVTAIAGLTAFGAATVHSASTTGNANGRLRLAVINIAEVTALDFGEVIVSGVAGAGTVVVDPVTNLDATNGGVQSLAFTPSRGEFNVTGNRPNGTYVVTLPAVAVTLACTTICAGADPTVDTFTFDSLQGGALPVLSAGPAPADTLRVGATLNFDPAVNDGDWAGIYTVDVVYN